MTGRTSRTAQRAALALLSTTALATSGDPTEDLGPAVFEDSHKTWNFEWRPYLWTASIEGDAAVAGLPAIDVDIGFDDILEELDFTFASTFLLENRDNNLVLGADVFYLRMSPSVPSPPGPAVDFGSLVVKQWLVDPNIGYRFHRNDAGDWADVFVGLRYTSFDLRLSTTVGDDPKTHVGDKEEWLDPHIGVRGRKFLNEDWYVGGLLDIGGFGVGADWAIQGAAGVGWQANDVLTLEFLYRYLYVDYSSGGFLWDTHTNGLFLGVLLSF